MRLPGGLENLTITPATTDFVEWIRASDGTKRKCTIANLIGGAAESFQSGISFTGATTVNTISIPDNLADALNIVEGSNSYLKFVTTNSGEKIVLGKVADVPAGFNFTGATGVNLLTLPDNLASSLDITEGANSYLKFVTTNSSEAIVAGKVVQLGAGLSSSDNLTMSAAAKGLVLKQGANGKCGTFVANGVTPVTVNNSSIAITDTIVISLNTVGGTVGVQPHVATITASTSFTVVCTASDTSTYNYAIISNAA